MRSSAELGRAHVADDGESLGQTAEAIFRVRDSD